MLGIDIVKVERFKKMENIDTFLAKFFTQNETEYISKKPNKFETIAGIFSAKESVLKAIGCGIGNGISLKMVEILHEKSGKPFALLHEKVQKLMEQVGIKKIEISISHTTSDAVSIAIGV